MSKKKTTLQLANKYAENQLKNYSTNTNSYLKSFDKYSNKTVNALDKRQQAAVNDINAQKQGILDAYHNNARQAYINSMLGKKSVEQQLSQAGLNTSGLVGSAYANVENAYGNNLAALQSSRDQSVNDINRQLNNANLEYSAQKNDLLARIGEARLELQKYGDQTAWNRLQDSIGNYLQFTNSDNDNYWRIKNFNYQKGRDKVADNQWKQTFNLQKKNSSSGRSSGSSGGYIIDSFDNDDVTSNLSTNGKKLYDQYVDALSTAANTGANNGGIVGKLGNYWYNTLTNPTALSNYIDAEYKKGTLTANDLKAFQSLLK